MTKITTYEPDNSLKKGYLSIFGDIVREYRENQWLIFQLFVRDFLSVYKQSFIGIVWVFIIPLAGLLTFIILRSSGVFSTGEIAVPYPLYAIISLAFWQLFSTGIVACSNSLTQAGQMLLKINFSKKSIVTASLGQAIVSFLIQFILVLVLFALYGIAPSVWIIIFPLLMIPLLLLSLGLGFILSLLNGISRDISSVLALVMTFLLFLTPILYNKPSSGILSDITEYNPLYYLIAGSRDLILFGKMSVAPQYLVSTGVSLAAFIIFIVIFHLTETRVAERI